MSEENICQTFSPCKNLDPGLMVLRTLEGPSLAAVEGIAFEDSLLAQLKLMPFLRLWYRWSWRIGSACVAPARTVLGLAPMEQITFQMRSARQLDFASLIRNAAERVHIDDTLDRTLTETAESVVSTEATSGVDTDTIDLGPFGTWGGSGDTTTTATEKVTENTTSSLDDLVRSISDTEVNSKTIELSAGVTLTTENAITRQMENPYFDRTMEIRMHPVFREVELVVALDNVETGIVITNGNLKADSRMMERHGAFLSRAALDRNVLNIGVSRLGEATVPPARTRTAVAGKDLLEQHLAANARYYAGAYVRHIRSLYGRGPIADLAFRTLHKSGLVRGSQPQLADAFAVERLQVAHNRVFLPVRDAANIANLLNLPKGFSTTFRDLLDRGFVEELKGKNRREYKLHLFMGSHLEVVAGTCLLQDAPPPFAEQEG